MSINIKRIFFLTIVVSQLMLILILVCGYIIGNKSFQKILEVDTGIAESLKKQKTAKNLNYYYDIIPEGIEGTIPWLNQSIRYSLNSEGFNQKDGKEYSLKKEDGVYRIIAIGDSFTFGLYVNSSQNYPSLLEDTLNKKCKNIRKFEVLNLGVPGYDIQYAVTRFEKDGLRYNPDLVLFLLKDDDFEQINEIMRAKQIEYSSKLKENGEFEKRVEKGDYYPDWTDAYLYLKNHYKESEILSLQNSFLRELRNEYTKKIVLFTFPLVKTQYTNLMKNYSQEEKDVYFFDKLTNIYKTGNYFPDKHPDQVGYEHIANDLYSYLLENKIIPCN